MMLSSVKNYFTLVALNYYIFDKLNSGNHSYTFSGMNLASAITTTVCYGEYRKMKKMILIK